MSSVRKNIAGKVRELRRQRHWTQSELAGRLGLSQGRFSQIERGDGSFTAEQLLELLRLFNVPVSHFSGDDDAAAADTQLQNALARLGAHHLRESTAVFVPGELDDFNRVVRTALLSGSARLITALAPVLIAHVDAIRLDKLRASLADAGLERRFLWLIDNVLLALRLLLRANPSAARRYARALVVLDNFASFATEDAAKACLATDLLDPDIRSEKTRQRVWAEASEPSRRWSIVTTLKPSDFREAIEAAHAAS